MAKLSQYVDKEHAVGHIECLERHFKQISDRLDRLGVPSTDKTGVRYTIYERVDIACLAVLAHSANKATREIVFEALRDSANDTSEEDNDPESIMEAIMRDNEPAKGNKLSTAFWHFEHVLCAEPEDFEALEIIKQAFEDLEKQLEALGPRSESRPQVIS